MNLLADSAMTWPEAFGQFGMFAGLALVIWAMSKI